MILGMIGVGKTQMAKRLLAITPRAIVLDRKKEYEDGQIFHTFKESAECFAANRNGDFHIIVRAEHQIEYFLWFRLILEAQMHEAELNPNLKPIGLFVEESSIYSDSHSIPPEVEEVYTLGRVPRINVVTVAQRDTQVNPLLRDQTHILVALRMHRPASRLGEDFRREELEVIPTLETIRPETTPIYYKHYLTNVGPINIFEDWTRFNM